MCERNVRQTGGAFAFLFSMCEEEGGGLGAKASAPGAAELAAKARRAKKAKGKGERAGAW